MVRIHPEMGVCFPNRGIIAYYHQKGSPDSDVRNAVSGTLRMMGVVVVGPKEPEDASCGAGVKTTVKIIQI